MNVSKSAGDDDFLVRERPWNVKSKRWSKEWKVKAHRRDILPLETSVATRTRSSKLDPPPPPAFISFDLPHGGTFTVYPYLLSQQMQEDITHELIEDNAHLFRQYSIQGTNEPRAHFLLHDDANNEDFETSKQPGYRYGTITMKAKPLTLLPKLEKISMVMAKLCGVESWNLGANPVLYRDCKDHMGLHTDDDQGEDKILTILTQSPSTPRRVVIETYHEDGRKEGDVQYELNLHAGDAYDMDGEMQQHYKHGVLSDVASKGERLVIVLRHGLCKFYTKDSGKSLEGDLKPRVIVPMSFGPVEGLVEGDSYERFHLKEIGAHSSPQGGISGNKKDGCDAIVVTGRRDDGLGKDSFETLVYAAETRQGAGAILTSMKEGKPIRVFRSSKTMNESPYRALEVFGKTQYRYDGLYCVAFVEYTDNNGEQCREVPDNVSKGETQIVYKFQLERDGSLNKKSTSDLVEYSITNKTLGPGARLELSSSLVEDESFSRAHRQERRAKRKLAFQNDALERRYNVGMKGSFNFACKD